MIKFTINIRIHVIFIGSIIKSGKYFNCFFMNSTFKPYGCTVLKCFMYNNSRKKRLFNDLWILRISKEVF